MSILTFKYIISVLLMVIIALGATACGCSYGNFTIGTTGYLRETNRARVIADYEQIDRKHDVINARNYEVK